MNKSASELSEALKLYHAGFFRSHKQRIAFYGDACAPTHEKIYAELLPLEQTARGSERPAG